MFPLALLCYRLSSTTFLGQWQSQPATVAFLNDLGVRIHRNRFFPPTFVYLFHLLFLSLASLAISHYDLCIFLDILPLSFSLLSGFLSILPFSLPLFLQDSALFLVCYYIYTLCDISKMTIAEQY